MMLVSPIHSHRSSKSISTSNQRPYPHTPIPRAGPPLHSLPGPMTANSPRSSSPHPLHLWDHRMHLRPLHSACHLTRAPYHLLTLLGLGRMHTRPRQEGIDNPRQRSAPPQPHIVPAAPTCLRPRPFPIGVVPMRARRTTQGRHAPGSYRQTPAPSGCSNPTARRREGRPARRLRIRTLALCGHRGPVRHLAQGGRRP